MGPGLMGEAALLPRSSWSIETGDRWGMLTPFLSASGAVHLTGSLLESSPFRSALARPKSLTLATRSSETRMLRAARSRCTSFLLSRYSIPSATCLRIDSQVTLQSGLSFPFNLGTYLSGRNVTYRENCRS